MGSLFSSPKTPKIKPYIPPVLETETDDVTKLKTDKEINNELRTSNLLRRIRSKEGTVLTGYKGYFDSNFLSENKPSKKLLGE